MPVQLNSSYWMLVTSSADLVFEFNRTVGVSGLTVCSQNNAVRFRQRDKVSMVQNTNAGERNAAGRSHHGRKYAKLFNFIHKE